MRRRPRTWVSSQTFHQESGKVRQRYDNVEEFLAVVVANIYRSENKRVGLRADHGMFEPGAPLQLAHPFTEARKFYAYWSKQLDSLCRQMLRFFIRLSTIQADWNPIRYSVMSVLRIDRPEKLRDYEATLDSYGW